MSDHTHHAAILSSVNNVMLLTLMFLTISFFINEFTLPFQPLRAQDESGSDDDEDSDDDSNWDNDSSSSSSSGDSDDDGLPAAGGPQLKGRAFWLKRAEVVKVKVGKDKVGRSEERKRLKEEAAKLREEEARAGSAGGVGERGGLLLPAEATLTPSLIQKKSLEILSSRGRKVSFGADGISYRSTRPFSPDPPLLTSLPRRVPTPRCYWHSLRR